MASITDEILDIEQNLLPASQQRAATAASDLYKIHASNGGAISLLLSADSFADFINLTKYLGSVQDANVAALNEPNKVEDEPNAKLDELSAAKDRADVELSRAYYPTQNSPTDDGKPTGLSRSYGTARGMARTARCLPFAPGRMKR